MLRTIDTYRAAVGQFLVQFPWDHFVTNTFQHPPSVERAQRIFSGWIRGLERRAQRRFDWHRVPEFTSFGCIHYHVLLVGSAGLTTRTLETSWHRGLARARVYNPSLGAARYLAKTVGAGWEDAAFSPCLRPPPALLR
jgi:hypothetical protein